MAAPTTTHDHHEHGHDDHHEQHWIWKYVFSTDHKTIGIQYGITGLVFLLFGFCLMLAMRWQLANPGAPMPLIGATLDGLGKWLAEPGQALQTDKFDGWFWLRAVTDQFPGGAMSADGYFSARSR